MQYATIENIAKIILLSKEEESLIEKYIMQIIKESMNVEKKMENILKIISDLDRGLLINIFWISLLNFFMIMLMI